MPAFKDAGQRIARTFFIVDDEYRPLFFQGPIIADSGNTRGGRHDIDYAFRSPIRSLAQHDGKRLTAMKAHAGPRSVTARKTGQGVGAL
jgi:hypothetical protein